MARCPPPRRSKIAGQGGRPRGAALLGCRSGFLETLQATLSPVSPAMVCGSGLLAAVALGYFAYTLINIHRTLRVTPAMAAGVTDRLWEVEDLAAAWEASERKSERQAAYRLGTTVINQHSNGTYQNILDFLRAWNSRCYCCRWCREEVRVVRGDCCVGNSLAHCCRCHLLGTPPTRLDPGSSIS